MIEEIVLVDVKEEPWFFVYKLEVTLVLPREDTLAYWWVNEGSWLPLYDR